VKTTIINKQMGKKLKISLFLLVAIAVFTFSVMSVMASATVVSPGASAVVSGTYILNASGVDLANCSFYAKSPSTANSSWTFLGSFVNTTAGSIKINGTFNSAVLEDSNDYTFNASCLNGSGQYHEGTRSGITIDNTVPTTPTLSPESNTKDTDGDVTFTGTVTGARTTGCILYFDGINPGSSSYTMTHSGNTCTYTKTAMPEQTYKWYVIASDGTNTSTSTTNTINVDVNTGGAKGGAIWYLNEQSSGNSETLSITTDGSEKQNNTIVIVVILLVIITIAVVLNKRR
jgi:hypothetical protein